MKKLNKIIKYLFHPSFFLLKLDNKNIIHLKDKTYLKIFYLKNVGKKLNLKNPQTFNEKLQWLKLNERNPKYTQMVDKYEVKKYVAKIIGDEYIIPTLGIYEKFDDIDFEKLPNKFVMKCTHDSGSTYVCTDKSKIDILELKEKYNKLLKMNYYNIGREWPYKNVKPRIIIEKYMVDESGLELKDYKFFCFNGNPKYIQLDFNRFINHHKNIYTTYWKLVPLEFNYPNDFKAKINKPKNLNEMVLLARKLSKNLKFARIDFYNINGKIFFGEITFFPAGGIGYFNPEYWNKKFGELIKL